MVYATEARSRTYQYRKVMKPMLERKRRARINKCLDELKLLMTKALHTEGENITKMEKADVLEVTVRHLNKLHTRGKLVIEPLSTQEDKFREGFSRCASEVSKCLASIPGVNIQLGTELMTHLGAALTDIEKRTPLSILVSSPSLSPAPSTASSGYSSAYDVSPGSSHSSTSPVSFSSSSSPMYSQGLLTIAKPIEPVWRPW